MVMAMPAAGARTALRDVRLEPMRTRHLRQVLEIEAAVYPRPWTPGVFASEIGAGRSRRYYVALAGGRRMPWARGRVVGYGGLLMQVDEAHVTTVAVHPHEHRRKIATRLLLRLLRDAREMGAEAATLEVRVGNQGAQRLYQAFGFAPVGVRPGYYAETREDALIMWLHDLQSDEAWDRLEAQADRVGEPGGASGLPDLDVPWVRDRIGLEG